MDCRSGPAWPDRQELRATASVAGVAGTPALSPQAGGKPGGRTQPAPEAPGNGQIKLASVATDVFGVSGRAMLKALIEGTASAETMADLAKGQLRRKRVDLVLARRAARARHPRSPRARRRHRGPDGPGRS